MVRAVPHERGAAVRGPRPPLRPPFLGPARLRPGRAGRLRSGSGRAERVGQDHPDEHGGGPAPGHRGNSRGSRGRPGAVNSPATCLALKDRYQGGLQAAFVSRYSFAILLSRYGLPAAFAITGALIGAPLVAREVEQRTHLAAWTQSVSRHRWYGAKISALASGLAVAGLIAGTVNAWLQHQLTAGDTASSRWSWFASVNLAPAGEAVLAFALAVAFGALLRRTLPAIGAALAGFTLLLLAARWVVQALTPASKTSGPHFTAPPGSWILGSGPASRSPTTRPASTGRYRSSCSASCSPSPRPQWQGAGTPPGHAPSRRRRHNSCQNTRTQSCADSASPSPLTASALARRSPAAPQ